MDPQAATPTGAEDSARAETSLSPDMSVKDRLKAHFASEQPEQRAAPVKEAAPVEAQEAEAEEVAAPEEAAPQAEDTGEEIQLQSIKDLSDATGVDLEKLMDLDIPTKIDGKEGAARLRDLIKSYQLEGHLNQKLMAYADERKAFETERQTKSKELIDKGNKLEGALRISQRLLDGEYSQVNWEDLRANNPVEFASRSADYQQRQQAIQHLAGIMLQEHQTTESETAKQRQAYLAEQTQLLDNKLPEWQDKAKRTKDIAEMATVLNDAYGFSEQELKQVEDHRLILIARDAQKWQQLQKSKPAILNKVKVAPKMLKPGAAQSKATQDGLLLNKDKARLRETGRPSDAKNVLKRILFAR